MYSRAAMSELAARLDAVRARIRAATEAAGRRAEDVRLIAVTKAQPAAVVREAYALGLRDFGENYVQELEAKAEELGDLPELRWHVIGHLQRNKVKLAVRHAAALHTVDSPRLSAELGRRAAEAPIPEPRRFPIGAQAPDGRLPVLIEVNVGGEKQKGGCTPDELGSVIAAVQGAPALRLAGLMTVPPHTADASQAQPFFESLAALREQHGGADVLPELSMGMTHDLEAAVAAGATLVRVGTAIFGPRGRAPR